MEDYSGEPCPWRIVHDCGGAFTMGLIGGGIFQGVKGFRNAPSGLQKRLQVSLSSVRERAPITAGHFAIWGGTFATVNCTLAHLRGREDAWNTIVSGALTGGVLVARQGVPAMVGSVVVGGVLMAFIEGAAIIITRYQAEVFDPTAPNY